MMTDTRPPTRKTQQLKRSQQHQECPANPKIPQPNYPSMVPQIPSHRRLRRIRTPTPHLRTPPIPPHLIILPLQFMRQPLTPQLMLHHRVIVHRRHSRRHNPRAQVPVISRLLADPRRLRGAAQFPGEVGYGCDEEGTDRCADAYACFGACG